MTTTLQRPYHSCPPGQLTTQRFEEFGTAQTRFERFVATGVSGSESKAPAPLVRYSKWRRLYGDLLSDVSRSRPAPDDEYEPPSQAALRSALVFADQMALENAPPPTRVSPDGEGGIVFERNGQNSLEVVEFDEDGQGEILVLLDNHIIHRLAL